MDDPLVIIIIVMNKDDPLVINGSKAFYGMNP